MREYMAVIQTRLEEQQKELLNNPMTQSNRAAAIAVLQQHQRGKPATAVIRQTNPQTLVAPQVS